MEKGRKIESSRVRKRDWDLGEGVSGFCEV